jgi:hypothetical protein
MDELLGMELPATLGRTRPFRLELTAPGALRLLGEVDCFSSSELTDALRRAVPLAWRRVEVDLA